MTFYIFMSYILGILRYLVDGDLVSDCPLPCKTTQTYTKFLYETKSESSGIAISLPSKIKVTNTDLVRPTFTNFLSEVQLI